MNETTKLQAELDRLACGEPGALSRVMGLAYDGLVRQARAALGGHTGTSEAASLVHSALMPLLEPAKSGGEPLSFEGVGQFFAFTSRVLRHKLVDRIRRDETIKRGGTQTVVSLDGQDVPSDLRKIDYFDLHEALEELKALNERLWLVTENKCFARMTNAEVARGLDLSEKAIEKDWTFSRAWLAQRLGGGDDTRTVRAGA